MFPGCYIWVERLHCWKGGEMIRVASRTLLAKRRWVRKLELEARKPPKPEEELRTRAAQTSQREWDHGIRKCWRKPQWVDEQRGWELRRPWPPISIFLSLAHNNHGNPTFTMPVPYLGRVDFHDLSKSRLGSSPAADSEHALGSTLCVEPGLLGRQTKVSHPN